MGRLRGCNDRAMTATLVAKNLAGGFAHRTLFEGLDLTVAPGELVSLIGPSGCGKSTLLRLIANLLEPTDGSLLINGKPASQARLDGDYGMAFQQAGLLELQERVGDFHPTGLLV